MTLAFGTDKFGTDNKESKLESRCPSLVVTLPAPKEKPWSIKKMRQSRILIGELMPALVPSPLLVCFTGTIFARKNRVPMNPRKKAHYGHDQLKITGHLTTWTRTTISPFSRSWSVVLLIIVLLEFKSFRRNPGWIIYQMLVKWIHVGLSIHLRRTS